MILSNVIIKYGFKASHDTAAGYGYAVAANNSGIGQTLPRFTHSLNERHHEKHYDTKICR